MRQRWKIVQKVIQKVIRRISPTHNITGDPERENRIKIRIFPGTEGPPVNAQHEAIKKKLFQ